MKKFEYFIINFSKSGSNFCDLNKYGLDGWELVSFIEIEDYYKAIFKREIND